MSVIEIIQLFHLFFNFLKIFLLETKDLHFFFKSLLHEILMTGNELVDENCFCAYDFF